MYMYIWSWAAFIFLGFTHTCTHTHTHTLHVVYVSSAVPTFSSLSNTPGTSSLTVFGSGSEAGRVGGGEAGEKGEEGREGNGEGVVKEGRTESGRGEAGDGEVGAGNSMTAASVTLPEVQRVTGEEGEKKIVQVRNYVVIDDPYNGFSSMLAPLCVSYSCICTCIIHR